MFLVFDKSTKSFERFGVVDKDGVRGNVYLPNGYEGETITLTVIDPNHSDYAQHLAELKAQKR